MMGVSAHRARGRFSYPLREVGRGYVASAQDRGDAPSGEPLLMFHDGGEDGSLPP